MNADPGGSVEARNKSTVQAAFDAWRDGKGNPFDLLTDDASWTVVGHSDVAKVYPTREAFLAEVMRPFNARLSQGLKPTNVRNIHADGDTVIVSFDAQAMARDGLPYTNTYAWFLEMKQGRVVKATAFFDSVHFNDLWRRITP